MRRIHRIGDAWRRQLDQDEEPLRALIVLAIAGLTFLTAGLAGLQVDAGARAATAGRTADAIGAAATEQGTGALIQTQSDLGVYRRYIELVFDASWARRMGAEAATPPSAPGATTDAPDPALATALATIDAELAAWARSQSPMLRPPYWDDTRAQTDIGTYDADRNIGPQVRATLDRRIAVQSADTWGRRASDYVATVTVVAVGLFFLGLAAALAGTARRILATAGIVFGLVALAAGAAITLRPVQAVPDAAVDGVAAAEMSLVKVAWNGSPDDLAEIERQHYEAAIAAAERAVAVAPDFLPTRLTRADARVRYATDLLLARTPDPDTARPLLDLALEDFQAVTAAEEDSYVAWWNYGWAAYLAGKPDLAISATDRALALAPDQFTLYLNRALARLAAGDEPGATADVTVAIDVAGRARLDSNGWFFSRTDYNIGRLAEIRPAEQVALSAIQRRLREAAVALRIGRPDPSDAATVEQVVVRTLALGDDARLVPGEIVSGDEPLAPAGVAGFRLTLTGRDVPEGAVVSVRVHENGQESPEYRVDRPWPAGEPEIEIDLVSPYGRMGADVDPAAHEVEVFVDGRTRASTAFLVRPAVVFRSTASAFAELVAGSGFTCDAPVPSANDHTTTTCLTTGAPRDAGTEVVIVANATDEIRRVTVSGSTAGGLATGLVRELAGVVLGMVLEPSVASEATDWVEVAEPGSSASFGGASFSLTTADGRLAVTAEAP